MYTANGNWQYSVNEARQNVPGNKEYGNSTSMRTPFLRHHGKFGCAQQ